MKKLWVLSLFTLLLLPLKASHIVGGEINYKHLGGSIYRLELNVYFDCLTGSPAAIMGDSLSRMAIFDNANNQIAQFDISYGPASYLGGLNYACIVSPPNLCVMKRTYIDTVSIPNVVGGVRLAFERCCRNASIINIVGPGNEGATFWTTIADTTLQGPNSNPVFNSLPPIGLCVDAPFIWDHSATDIDGDSLVYELFQPYSYTDAATFVTPIPLIPPPFSNVTWTGAYTTANMMNTAPALAIHPNTGQLSVVPNSLGQYVVGIIVKEFRNGVQIGETRRDYQFNVVQCNFTVVSAFTAPVYNCSNTINFVNNSSGADYYIWEFGDTTTAGPDTSSASSPDYTYPGPGEYDITLIAVDTNCSDTFQTTVVILPDIYLDADIDTIVCPGSSFTIGEDSAGPYPATYLWTPPTYLDNAAIQNPITTPVNDIIYIVSKTIGNCSQSDTVIITVVDLEPTHFTYGFDVNCINVLAHLGIQDSLNQFNQFQWVLTDSPPLYDTLLNNNPVTYTTNLGDSLDIQLTYYNSGCIIPFDTILVTPTNGENFKDPMPNIITPNDQFPNDCFEVSNVPGGQLRCFSLYIYDRWGVKIYENGDGLCWNGRDMNGTLMNEGVYYYVIESETYNKAGFIHLFMP